MNLRIPALFAILAAGLFGQPSTQAPGPGPVSVQLGFRVVPISDINGDGIRDYVASRHTDTASTATPPIGLFGVGAVEVRDGATDTMIWQRFGGAAQEYYGRSLGAADWNGDGILDVIAVAQQTSNPARIEVLDGTTGTLLTSLSVPSGAFSGEVGTSISGGDIDNDGFDEIVLGTSPVVYQSFTNVGAPGAVVIFNSVTGSTVVTDSEGDFGRQVRVIQDIDFDGQRDILVSAPWANRTVGSSTLLRTGLIRAMSSGSLNTIWQVRGDVAGATIGNILTTTPDLDSDFLNEVATVSLVSGATLPAQEIRVLSGNDRSLVVGGPLATSHTPVGEIRAISDLDGDGFPELIVPGVRFAAPFVVVSVYSLLDLHLVDQVVAESDGTIYVDAVVTSVDTNGNGWPEILLGRSQANATLGAVERRELRPALPALADGSPLHDLLVVNGSAALPSRRVDLAIGQPFTIGVDPDPTTGQPTDFIIWGLIGVPNLGSVYNVTGGSFLFPPRIAAPALPWLFTLTDSIGFDPAAAFPGFLAPWSIGAPFGIAIPIDLTFQGVTISGGNIDITNGILLSVR